MGLAALLPILLPSRYEFFAFSQHDGLVSQCELVSIAGGVFPIALVVVSVRPFFVLS